MVFSLAQLMTRTKVAQYGSSVSLAAFGSAPVTMISVQAVVEQIVGAAVVPVQIIAPPVRARRRLHVVKMQPDEKSSGRCIEQVEQLALSRYQGGIGHVVDQTNVEAFNPPSWWRLHGCVSAPRPREEVMVVLVDIDQNRHGNAFIG